MRQLLHGSAVALVVLLTGTTIAPAQSDDVKALAKLVETQGPLKKEEDGTNYAKELNAAIDKLNDLAQFRSALLDVRWQDVRPELNRIQSDSTITEKELEKAPIYGSARFKATRTSPSPTATASRSRPS